MDIRPPLDVERLRAALAPRWARVDVVEVIESTNADLLARSEAPDRTLLAAEHQTSGRGRFDRSWTSPPRAGLTFSVLLRPTFPLAHWGWVPLLAAVALAEAVDDVAGVDAAVKWPNDLLIGPEGRKAAGILAQAAGDAVVIGIGLNVTTQADELPVPSATSLALHAVGPLDRTDVLIAVATRIDARAAQWADCGGDAEACGLAAAYRERCATLGAPVRVSLAHGAAVTGTAHDIDPLGRLVVTTPRGRETVVAGDVEHVRPS